jgi:radical SAM superfamily enzyme YgiQ (UPF0313 family)
VSRRYAIEPEQSDALAVAAVRDEPPCSARVREQHRRDLDELPVPDLSLIVGAESTSSTPNMTSLGCPFNCNFCSVTSMFRRRYRYRSAEHVLAELEQKRPRRIFFYDDNFAADRSRLKTMLGLMIEHDLVAP